MVPAFELEHVEIELCGSCERLGKIVRRPGVVLEYEGGVIGSLCNHSMHETM